MSSISPFTFASFEKKPKLVQKIIDHHLSEGKIATLFTKLKRQDIAICNASCFTRTISCCFIGRFCIALFFRKKALEVVDAVARKYLTTKVVQFSCLLDQKKEIHPSKDERTRLAFLVSKSPLMGEIQHKVHLRNWKRWQAKQMPQKLFERIYPNNDGWMQFFSDRIADKYFEKHLDTSDNSEPLSRKPTALASLSHPVSTSDNTATSLSAITPKDLQNAQTLPFYFSSVEEFLAYLLDSKDQSKIIDHLSKLAANYTAKNSTKYRNIFISWADAFAKTHVNPKKISKDNVQIDFADYPRLKPFVPLLEYLPALVESFKHTTLHLNTLSKLNFQDLTILLDRDQIFVQNTLEEQVAAFILPLVQQFVEGIDDALEDEEKRKEWLRFCKDGVKSWNHPFYSGLLAFAEWTPESVLKFFIKNSLSSYEPMLKVLKHKQDRLLPMAEKLVGKAEKKIKKCQQYMQDAEEDSVENYIKEWEEYRDGIKNRYKLVSEKLQNQINWEKTKEALELDQCIAKIYDDFYKDLILAWLDKHSVKPFIRCIKVYRQITTQLNNLFQKTVSLHDRESKIKEIKQLTIQLMLQLLHGIDHYSKEMPNNPIEISIFSIVKENLLKMNYQPNNIDFTHQTWQHLIVPIVEMVIHTKLF